MAYIFNILTCFVKFSMNDFGFDWLKLQNSGKFENEYCGRRDGFRLDLQGG